MSSPLCPVARSSRANGVATCTFPMCCRSCRFGCSSVERARWQNQRARERRSRTQPSIYGKQVMRGRCRGKCSMSRVPAIAGVDATISKSGPCLGLSQPRSSSCTWRRPRYRTTGRELCVAAPDGRTIVSANGACRVMYVCHTTVPRHPSGRGWMVGGVPRSISEAPPPTGCSNHSPWP